MNYSAINLLKAVKNGTTNTKDLMKIIGVKEWQFNTLVKDLIEDNYVEKVNSSINLGENSKIILFRDIANKFDIEKLLHDSNEIVFMNLTMPITINALQQTTKLSLRTVQRSISELQSIGAIQKEANGQITINSDHHQLYLFAELLRREKEREGVESYSEIIYKDAQRILKKVPKGKSAEGELTGFSLFSDYGIKYITTHDYYIKQEVPIHLQDVLVHAILASVKDHDKNGITMATLFYLKNRERMDPIGIRTAARSFGIFDIWIDIEGFIRNNELKHPDLFPSRQEFEEKAILYDISRDFYTLPVAYPDLFTDISKNLETEAELYLFGGENMRLKGLKAATKDCDIAVVDEGSFRATVDALKKMGYQSINKSKFSQDDLRVDPSDMLVHASRSRVDIFKTVIARKLILSERMRRRAKIENYGKLKLGIIKNEDVFLLKGVTLREGDIHDMTKIAQSEGFDWKIVFEELVAQEDDTSMNFSSIFLESLDDLRDQTGIRPPFYKKLISRVLTHEINQLVRKGKVSLEYLVDVLQGDGITEKTIRNKVDYLERKKFLAKINERGEVFLRPRKRNVLNVSTPVELNVQNRIVNYIEIIHRKLALSETVKNEAIEIAKKITTNGALQGRRPNVIATGIFDWINRRDRLYLTVTEIADAGDVAMNSLQSIRKNLDTLLPQIYQPNVRLT
jgi:predicted transcriptional regulator